MNAQRPQQIERDCRNVAGSQKSLESLRGARLVITGGKGFVGTWLTELCCWLNDEFQFGTKVTIYAPYSSSYSKKAPHLAQRPDIAWVEKDVRSLQDFPEDTNWIVHAAGSPDNRLHSSDPVRTIDVITNGTRAVLLSASRLPDLRKMLHLSSGLVAGPQPGGLPHLSENDYFGIDCRPVSSCYVEAKRLSETLCAAYRNEHRLPVVTARPFAFIGPYQLLDRPWAINNFIRDGLLGGPIRVQGDGAAIRAYMYGADMAYWLLNILLHGRTETTYNVGSPEAVTLKDLAEKVASQFTDRPKIEYGVLKGGRIQPSSLVPDVLAASALGLDLKTDLNVSLRFTVAWNRQ